MCIVMVTALHQCEDKDGGDAAAQYVVDRGSVPEEGGGRSVSV